jgi:hypothetical protein
VGTNVVPERNVDLVGNFAMLEARWCHGSDLSTDQLSALAILGQTQQFLCGD